jgi:hypothetical protein
LKEKIEILESKSKHKITTIAHNSLQVAASVTCISQALELKERLGAWKDGERGKDEIDGMLQGLPCLSKVDELDV